MSVTRNLQAIAALEMGRQVKNNVKEQTKLQQRQAAAAAAQHDRSVTAWREGWQSGRHVGFNDGWRAGQADLVAALKTGRVRLEDL